MHNLSATCRIYLDIPEGRAMRMLVGTDWEGGTLADISDDDRERVGQLLDKKVSESLADLMEYCHDDADVDVDW